jgi:hypothetical protein
MKTRTIISTIVAATILIGGMHLGAQDQPKDKGKSEEKAKRDTYPFNGKIGSVDKSAKTVTLQGKEKARVIQITGETRILKAGKAATLDDATPGEDAGGLVKRGADGKEVATMLRIGPRPDADKAKPKKEDKK